MEEENGEENTEDKSTFRRLVSSNSIHHVAVLAISYGWWW